MPTTNLAIISAGHVHAKMFIESTLKATDGRKVTHVWDDDAARGQKYAALCGAAFEPNLEKLVGDASIDGFIICKENTQHLPLLEKVIRSGKAVMLEKPLVTTTADLAVVTKLHAQYPAPLFCAYVLPFSGMMKAVSELVKAKAFGDILRVKFRNSHVAAYSHMFDEPERAWLHDPKLSGGGALLDGGQQAVHLLHTLFGPVTEVWAFARNESGIYPRVDDFGMAHLKFASGIFGTIEVGWTQTGGISGLEISGSKTTLWTDGKKYYTGITGKEATEVIKLDEDPIRVDRFVAAIRGDIPAAALERDFEANRDTVCIIEAMYESVQKGAWVKVRAKT